MKIQIHPLQNSPNSKQNLREWLHVNQRTCTSTNTNENSKHTHCRVPNRLAQHDWWAGGSTLLQVRQLHPAQIFLYLYLRFNFYYICIWICFLTVFVFCQEQLPFVTKGVKNYSSCQHILTTTSWHIGPKIFNFDFHFLGRIPQRKAFTSIFCRQDIWTRNFLLLLFLSAVYSNNELNILVGRISERGTGGETGVSGPRLRSIGQNLQVEKCCC